MQVLRTVCSIGPPEQDSEPTLSSPVSVHWPCWVAKQRRMALPGLPQSAGVGGTQGIDVPSLCRLEKGEQERKGRAEIAPKKGSRGSRAAFRAGRDNPLGVLQGQAGTPPQGSA